MLPVSLKRSESSIGWRCLHRRLRHCASKVVFPNNVAMQLSVTSVDRLLFFIVKTPWVHCIIQFPNIFFMLEVLDQNKSQVRKIPKIVAKLLSSRFSPFMNIFENSKWPALCWPNSSHRIEKLGQFETERVLYSLGMESPLDYFCWKKSGANPERFVI